MDTLKTNKQFAKFLGLTHKATKGGFAIKGIVVKYQNLNFHNDWNSLMEVVEKIDSLCRNTGFEIYSRYVHIRVNNNLTISSGICSNKIEAVYNACLLFIEWYNEQNK